MLTGHTSTVWCIDFEKPTPNAIPTPSRLVSCSDDLTVRIWTRASSPSSSSAKQAPSILRTTSIKEEWNETVRLPVVHTRTIYAVSWSASRPGRIVSCGGDGRIVVYEEIEVDAAEQNEKKSEWRVIAEIEQAHGVYEVNNVCWAKRWDKGKRFEGEELVISTGDDGVVSFWELEDA